MEPDIKVRSARRRTLGEGRGATFDEKPNSSLALPMYFYLQTIAFHWSLDLE